MNDGQKEGNRRKGMIQRSALQPLRASQCKGEISLFVSIAAAAVSLGEYFLPRAGSSNV